MIIILSVTGHRPAALGGYRAEVWTALVDLAKLYIAELNPLEVWTGGAQGWDQACCEAAIQLGIPFSLVLPCLPHNLCNRWAAQSQQYFHGLYDKSIKTGRPHAQRLIIMDAAYSVAQNMERNDYLVQNCNTLLALYSGKTTGGTAHAVAYAERLRKPVINAWLDYLVPEAIT